MLLLFDGLAKSHCQAVCLYLDCLYMPMPIYACLPEWIIVHVHDLFLISFSDGNSPNQAIFSCQNSIMLEKPYKIAFKVTFFWCTLLVTNRICLY